MRRVLQCGVFVTSPACSLPQPPCSAHFPLRRLVDLPPANSARWRGHVVHRRNLLVAGRRPGRALPRHPDLSVSSGVPSPCFALTCLPTGVALNGQVEQVTIHGLVVQESGDNTCLATGPGAFLLIRKRQSRWTNVAPYTGQNTQSIVSYASALNSSYTWHPQVSLVSTRWAVPR